MCERAHAQLSSKDLRGAERRANAPSFAKRKIRRWILRGGCYMHAYMCGIVASSTIWYSWVPHNQDDDSRGQASSTNTYTLLWHASSFRPTFPHTSQAPPTTCTEDPHNFVIRRMDHISPMHGSLNLTLFYVEIFISYHLMCTMYHGPHRNGHLRELKAAPREISHHLDLVQ
jgi:hypothetical protein